MLAMLRVSQVMNCCTASASGSPGMSMDAADDENRPPLLLARHIEVEQQGLIDIQHARGVFGPLQVAAHPVTVLGDAANHVAGSVV